MPARKKSKKKPPPTREELLERCGELARCENILAEVEDDVRAAGFAGPATRVQLVYLAITSRLTAHPVSVAIRGPSSSGKSHTIKQALAFHPPEAFVELTAMSDKALAYFDEDLRHRVLVVYEGAGFAGDFVAYAIRSLLSEGQLRYEYTDFDARKTRTLVKEGPTGLLTSTAGTIDRELGTRLITPNVSDGPELTEQILISQARAAAGERCEVDYGRHHDLQRLIAAGPREVLVPFSRKLVDGIDKKALRVRRDFAAVLALIGAHALLHQESRERDGAERLLATVADYAAVHKLVASMVAEAAEQTVPPEVRETVELVQRKEMPPYPSEDPMTIKQLKEKLGLDRSTVNRRVNRAISLGYLVDTGENKRGAQKKLRTGDFMPEDAGVLPDPDSIS